MAATAHLHRWDEIALEKITEKLLGDRNLWRDNWRLNPQVKDPERLRALFEALHGHTHGAARS